MFQRTGPDTLVAARTLIVGCIRLGRHFRIFNFIEIVAVQAYIRRWGIFFRVFEVAFTAGDKRFIIVAGMVMAVVAGNVIDGGMLVMFEEDIAGGTAVLDADGLFRGFGGEGGVAEETYDEENDGHAVDQLQIFA